MKQITPNFAIRVMVFKDKKILIGKNSNRDGRFAPGKHGIPGGHIEYMESFEGCAKREVMEECGIEIKNIKFQAVANNKDDVPYHNIHIILTADWKNGEPKVLEPEKTESWGWYDIENLPKPIFRNVELAVEGHKTGKNYFDTGG